MPCNHGRGTRRDIGCMGPTVLDAAADPYTDAVAMRVG